MRTYVRFHVLLILIMTTAFPHAPARACSHQDHAKRTCELISHTWPRGRWARATHHLPIPGDQKLPVFTRATYRDFSNHYHSNHCGCETSSPSFAAKVECCRWIVFGSNHESVCCSHHFDSLIHCFVEVFHEPAMVAVHDLSDMMSSGCERFVRWV